MDTRFKIGAGMALAASAAGVAMSIALSEQPKVWIALTAAVVYVVVMLWALATGKWR